MIVLLVWLGMTVSRPSIKISSVEELRFVKMEEERIPFLTVLNNFFVCLSSANGFAKGTRASFGMAILGFSSISSFSSMSTSFETACTGAATGELSLSSTMTTKHNISVSHSRKRAQDRGTEVAEGVVKVKNTFFILLLLL